MSVLDLDRRTLCDFIGALSGYDVESIRHYARGEIVTDLRARECYSYGRHFPLCRQIAAPTRAYPRGRWLINGDRWRGSGGWHPSRTPEHQQMVRELLDGAPCVTLPFGALTGAGIELESIRELDTAPDRWLELEREARSLEEMPKRERRESYEVERSARELELVPARYRSSYREATDAERAELEARGEYAGYTNRPILRDETGAYRWTETLWRDVKPDADGIYRWTERAHVLGESVFTARRTATGRRRAKYLSGFDTNESPALYFLAELPAGAPSDIEGARLALAPPAVHAAIARGRIVERQGDIFLVDTELDRAELEARGAVFARLTLWSRDAKPREGEATYRRPRSLEARRRLARRELRRARELWRESFERWSADATYRPELEQARELAREARSAQWRELEARQSAELERWSADTLGPCGFCDAGIGETHTLEHCRGETRRLTLAELHKSQRATLERERRRPDRAEYLAPRSPAGIRERRRERLERASSRLADTREGIRRAIFSGPERRTDFARRRPNSYAYETREPTPTEAREAICSRLERARRAETEARAEYLAELYGGARSSERDATARAPRAPVALELWRRALEQARRELRPETFEDSAGFRSRREAIRAAVSIYGTAHTATELARVNGTVYVRGTVTHRPELDASANGRWREPDHRPLPLTAGRWYLAVRNSVPRARGADNGA